MDLNHEGSAKARDLSTIENSFYKVATTNFGIWSWDLKREIMFFPYSYDLNKNKNINKINFDDFKKLIHPDDIEYIKDKINNYIDDKNNDYCILEYRVKTKNGDYRWHLNRGLITRYEDGRPIRIRGTFIDITEQKKVQEQLDRKTLFLKSSKERHELVLLGSNDGIWDTNLVNNEVYYSQKYLDLFGFNDKEFEKTDYQWEKLIHPLDHKRVMKCSSDYLGKKIDKYKCEYRMRKKDGNYIWVLDSGQAIWDENGKPLRFAGSLTDITEKKERENIIYNMAYFDNLTELPNRAKLNNDLKSIINKARKKNTIFGLMLMDIDDFKSINDTMGHDAGDKLLKAISKRIKNTLPQNCMIYRLGGDEFVILVDNIDVGYTDNIAKLILECISKPFVINGMEIFSSVSIGIAVYPDKCDDEHRILENADVAMYKAKSNGKNSYRMYDSYMNLEIINRMKLEGDLRRAIKNNEFEVYYQPQNHSKTGKIKGVEALVRWNHPSKGIVAPGQFISLAEETGLINDISEFVIRTACKQVKEWNEIIDEPIRVSINLSARQFQKQNLVDTIKSILEETEFSPKNLEFEITESIAMKDFELTMRIIKELKLMGIKISLDDFGTGYSSLNYLQKLEVNTLKIDKTFIDDLAFSSSKRSIVRNIIELAHELNLKVIAEGVEKEEQLKQLILDRCDEVQGYLFSKPIPAHEFEKLLIGHMK